MWPPTGSSDPGRMKTGSVARSIQPVSKYWYEVRAGLVPCCSCLLGAVSVHSYGESIDWGQPRVLITKSCRNRRWSCALV